LEGPDYLSGQQGRKQRKRSASSRHATVQRDCPGNSAGNWHAAVHPSQHATNAAVQRYYTWGETGARHAAVNAPKYATNSSVKWYYPWSKTSARHAAINAPRHATKSSVDWNYPWSETSARHAAVNAPQYATVDASKYAAVQRNYSRRKTNSRHAADAAVQWNYAGSKTRPQHATFDAPQYATDERFRHETSGASHRETGATSETRDSAATLVRSRNFVAVHHLMCYDWANSFSGIVPRSVPPTKTVGLADTKWIRLRHPVHCASTITLVLCVILPELAVITT